jgi:hypothetical protein
MSMITTAFADALVTVRRPGDFFVAGSQQMLAPGLEVEGIGPVGLPLPAVQAEQLVAAAELAPYGRGSDTVTDTQVRRTWQISPDRVRIRGKHWPGTLQAIMTRVAEGLGVADPIEAELYKLLVYDKGSFFVPHRDTEKVPGMFATLVLVMPSVSEGGALIVRHKDREARLDLHGEEPSEVAFAAFYADCVHEVSPVTSGYRLVLVYNLVRRGSGLLPQAPSYDNEVTMVAERLGEWVQALRAAEELPHTDEDPDEADDDLDEEAPDDLDEEVPDDLDEREPQKLIYPLEHAYTPAELSFAALKGADAGIAQVVVAAAERAGCAVHLALVSVEESGSAEQTGGFPRSRRGRYDDDEDEDEEFEVIEVGDRQAIAAHWCRPDGQPSPLTELPVEENEFSPPLSFDELDPDEEHFHEATGNEGATYERTYRRTALILWPRERVLAVLAQGGLGVTLPFLEDLAARWAEAGDPAIQTEAGALADRMIAGWPMRHWYPNRNSERTSVGRFLDVLVRLNDSVRLGAFLTALVGRRGLDIGDNADVVAALRVLPRERAAEHARDLIKGAADTALTACGGLLAGIAAWDPTVGVRAARTLVGALPGAQAAADAPGWRRDPSVQPSFVVDLLSALGAIDATLAAVAVDHILDWPATYDFDNVLVPAVLTLLDTPEVAGQAEVQRLGAACAAHLDRRIALPLEPPADWRRDDAVACSCEDCRALARFLGDAGQRNWVFAAAQPRRSHVEGTIRNSRCDVDFVTEKRGSPHRLVCTKNQASYQRRCVQRTSDLQQRARLGGL